MSTNDDKTYLSHIRDAIEAIEGYLEGVTYEAFTADKMMVDAVVRELEIIGEASSKLSREFRMKHGHILWRQIKDMRSFLIHDYFGVNTKVVWDTCKQDLPQLKTFVEETLGR
ncbi:MAG: DUF86 domain-containing protein [Sedimentisphaerales bacterium]|nr:DUF86 domain-containing protein [Sedimentisphaerales bacterium]